MPILSVTRTPSRRAFSIVELLVVLAIVVVLMALLAPSLKRNRKEVAQSQRSGIAATLTRFEKAKALHVTDHHLKNGEPVTARDLVRGGYLSEQDINDSAAQGIHFIVGPVGKPVTYTFESEPHTHEGEQKHAHDASPSAEREGGKATTKKVKSAASSNTAPDTR